MQWTTAIIDTGNLLIEDNTASLGTGVSGHYREVDLSI